MQPSYDADDFMRRGFFGSFIGFRKRTSSKTDSASQQVAPKLVPPVVVQSSRIEQPVQLAPIGVPSEYDIYREIVTEAQFIERSAPATPDFSCPTTPQPSYYPPPPSQHFEQHTQPHLLAPPTSMHYHMAMSPIAPHPIPVDTNGVPIGNQCPMAPPPYSSSSPIPQMTNIPFDVKREIQEHLVVHNGKQQMSIEEIVKLVVVALKDSQLEESREEESPEEILRRKRVQNNLAAARYRKRQREARESAEQELGDLTRRNDELREQVERMELQIRELKSAVLNRH